MSCFTHNSIHPNNSNAIRCKVKPSTLEIPKYASTNKRKTKAKIVLVSIHNFISS
jgi:hypothetical protein